MDEVTKKGAPHRPCWPKRVAARSRRYREANSDSRRRSGCPNRRSFEQPARRFAPPLLARAICE